MELTLEQKLSNQKPIIDYYEAEKDKQEERGFKSKVIDYLKSISESKFVKEKTRNISSSKVEMNSSLISTLTDGFKSGMQELAPELRPIVNTVEKTNTFVKKVVESAKSDTAKIIRATKERYDSFTNNNKKSDSKLKETIENNSITVDKLEKAPAIKSISKASRLFVGIKKGLALLLLGLKIGLKTLLAGALTYMASIAFGFKDELVSGFKTYVSEPIGNMVESIKETANRMWDAVKALPSQFAESIKAVFDKINPFNNDTVKEVISTTSDAIRESSVGQSFVKISNAVQESNDRFNSAFEKVRTDNTMENVKHATVLASKEVFSWLQSANSYLNQKTESIVDSIKETFDFRQSESGSYAAQSNVISRLQTETTVLNQANQQRRDAVNEQLAGGINAITSVQNVNQTTNNYAAPFSFTGDESMGLRNYGAQPTR